MANQVQLAVGTAVLFGSEVGDDVAWTMDGLADNAGRQSAFLDLGAAPRARFYRWRFWTQFQATPTLNAFLRLYLKTGGSETSSPDHPDNDDGAGDIAVSTEDKLRNLTPLGSLIVDEAAASVEMVAHGLIEIPERHVAVVGWNDSGATISATEAATKLRIVPILDEIQ